MDVCLMVEGQEGVTWDQWVALAHACEEHGLQGLFRSDHYVSMGRPTERGSLDAWATLAALTGHTDRIRLGTMVSPATFRHPSELAKAVVTADHASGGRVELGMGAGWFQEEHRAYGFPFPSADVRYEMLEEQVEIVHRLWDRDEDSVTFVGGTTGWRIAQRSRSQSRTPIPRSSSAAEQARAGRRWPPGGRTSTT